MNMSMKKIPAVLLLAIFCLAAFCASAFAAETAEVRIPVVVELKGEKPSSEEIYTFDLQAVGEAPMPSESTVKITGDGETSFPAICYTAPGEYCYMVTQQPGTNKNGHYDKIVYYVKVIVTNGESGGLETVITAHIDAEMASEKRDIVFVNGYDIVNDSTEASSESEKTKETVKETVKDAGTGSTPKTGDEMNILVWIYLAAFSGGILLALLAGRIRGRRS